MIGRDLVALLRRQFRLDWEGVHGVPHWTRVRNNGIRIGRANGASLRVVELFAFLHDACRTSDGHDPEHGLRAAELACELRGEYFVLDDQEMEDLVVACMEHSSGLIAGRPSVVACWDADRLDLGRVGVVPHADYLCTDYAKKPATIEWAYQRSVAPRRRAASSALHGR